MIYASGSLLVCPWISRYTALVMKALSIQLLAFCCLFSTFHISVSIRVSALPVDKGSNGNGTVLAQGRLRQTVDCDRATRGIFPLDRASCEMAINELDQRLKSRQLWHLTHRLRRETRYLRCPPSFTVGGCTVNLDYDRDTGLEPVIFVPNVVSAGWLIARKCIRVRDHDGGQSTYLDFTHGDLVPVTLSIKHGSGSANNSSATLTQFPDEGEMREGEGISADEAVVPAKTEDASWSEEVG